MSTKQRSAPVANEAETIAQANRYLSRANRPGEARSYSLAQASLRPFIKDTNHNPELWLAWAQIQQHLHQFDEAQRALLRITNINPHDVNANLLAARIYVIQGDPLSARQSCLKLLGYSDLLTASACVLEITSQEPTKLAQSYQQLQQLITREGMPGDERSLWLAQLLADMAVRLGDYKAAADWLEPQLSNPNLNLLAQWAHIQLALGKHQQLLNRVEPILDQVAEPDDALLLPMAIAEQSIGISTKWKTLLSERVVLREQRHDRQHANELARYFLELDLQPQKALYWAQLHYENSREASDKQLLERAQIAARSTPEVL